MSLVTADTSVAVPALADWHEHHDIARAATVDVDRLPAHVLVETFSVLTRLPHGRSLAPGEAASLILGAFPGTPLTLQAEAYRTMLQQLGAAGIRGGAVYDALVAAAAAGVSAELLTLDARAAATYRTVGARFRSPADAR